MFTSTNCDTTKTAAIGTATSVAFGRCTFMPRCAPWRAPVCGKQIAHQTFIQAIQCQPHDIASFRLWQYRTVFLHQLHASGMRQQCGRRGEVGREAQLALEAQINASHPTTPCPTPDQSIVTAAAKATNLCGANHLLPGAGNTIATPVPGIVWEGQTSSLLLKYCL